MVCDEAPIRAWYRSASVPGGESNALPVLGLEALCTDGEAMWPGNRNSATRRLGRWFGFLTDIIIVVRHEKRGVGHEGALRIHHTSADSRSNFLCVDTSRSKPKLPTGSRAVLTNYTSASRPPPCPQSSPRFRRLDSEKRNNRHEWLRPAPMPEGPLRSGHKNPIRVFEAVR
jgi:hypothetical protein